MWFKMCLSAFLCLCRSSCPEAPYEYQDHPFGERCGTDANLCPGLPLGEGFVWRLVNWAAVANRFTMLFIFSHLRVHVTVHLFACEALWLGTTVLKSSWRALTFRVCAVHFVAIKIMFKYLQKWFFLLRPWTIRPSAEHFEARRESSSYGLWLFCFAFLSYFGWFMKT